MMEEKKWRKKSRVIWLENGYLSTKLFHSYVENMRVKNFILELNDSNN